MKREKEWLGSKKCDFCNTIINDILIDGKTTDGYWATMCKKCHKIHGIGKFGIGCGQKYEKNSENRFIKIEG